MKIFKIHTKQKLPISVDEAWDFLSNPKNLKTITPNEMNFKLLIVILKKFIQVKS